MRRCHLCYFSQMNELVINEWTACGYVRNCHTFATVLNTVLLLHLAHHQVVTCSDRKHRVANSGILVRHRRQELVTGKGGAAGFVRGRISDIGSLRLREVKKDRQDKAEDEELVMVLVLVVCTCDIGGKVSEKLHGEGLERPINTNLLPAQWATSSQVGVVSIAVNAIYLMYWPITTSPLCVPAEGSPAVSQQGHRRTIDWGVVLFLQADPHSCFCLLLFLYPTPPSFCPFFSLPLSICFPLPAPLYLLPCLPLSLRLFLPPSPRSPRTGYRRIVRLLLQKSIISF